MSETVSIRPYKMSLDVSADGNIGRLSFTDEENRSCAIELTLEGFDWLLDQLPQLLLNAQGEHALGKKSALIPDRSGPQPSITTHAVTKFLLVGYDAGGTIVEFLTHKNEPIRLSFLPELAADLAEHLTETKGP